MKRKIAKNLINLILVNTYIKYKIPRKEINAEYYISRIWIFSEIDESLDFHETLINGSVLNVVSMNNISFLWKSLFQKLSAFKVIQFACNSEKKKTLIFHVYCMLHKTF